mmetsp:Transcript_28249/g.74710  ORF Transcript_28249/g.74710 Transcript_28249/m.74710 type:complete len:274 (+) Transcript_28249:10-831(+)
MAQAEGFWSISHGPPASEHDPHSGSRRGRGVRICRRRCGDRHVGPRDGRRHDHEDLVRVASRAHDPGLPLLHGLRPLLVRGRRAAGQAESEADPPRSHDPRRSLGARRLPLHLHGALPQTAFVRLQLHEARVGHPRPRGARHHRLRRAAARRRAGRNGHRQDGVPEPGGQDLRLPRRPREGDSHAGGRQHLHRRLLLGVEHHLQGAAGRARGVRPARLRRAAAGRQVVNGGGAAVAGARSGQAVSRHQWYTEVTFGRGALSVCPFGGFMGAKE